MGETADASTTSASDRLLGQPRLLPHPTERLAWGLLISSYLFGMLMLGHRLHPNFVYLTAPHLLLSTVLLLSAHRPQGGARLYFWAAICFCLGWGAEYIGVHGGWLFGRYVYGDVLGPKLFAIPLIIGVNWVLVVYAVCATVSTLLPLRSRWWKTLLATVLLVALDVLIEPVAVALDFWTWADGTPPLQNYLGWAVVGLLQVGLCYWILPYIENRLAHIVLALQVLFFGYLNIWL